MSVGNETTLPLLQKFYSLEAIAREPWSDDSVVYVSKKEQLVLEQGGAESIATLIYLNLLNVPHQIRFVKNVTDMSPSGRGPLLKCGRYSVGEFEPIVNFCNLKGIRLLSDYVDHSKRSQIKSYILLISKTYSDLIDLLVWRDSNSNIIKKAFTANYPWPLSYFLYLNEQSYNKTRLRALNLWDLDKKEVLARFVEVNEALNRKLEGGKLYLIEDRLSEADILLYSYLRVLSNTTELHEALETLTPFINITDFYANLNSKYDKILSSVFNTAQDVDV